MKRTTSFSETENKILAENAREELVKIIDELTVADKKVKALVRSGSREAWSEQNKHIYDLRDKYEEVAARVRIYGGEALTLIKLYTQVIDR